jgi:D-cysteine desulfhydrase
VRPPERWARRPLALLPTPVHRLHALERALGSGPVYCKRDDLVGFGLAGNKARPLEFLLGDALARGADVLVTGGAPGSNFVGAAALAARVCGLDCEVLVAGAAPERLPVPLELARSSGAELTFAEVPREDLDRLVAERAAELRRFGRHPYAVGRGGANPVGALGFAMAAGELAGQLEQLPDLVAADVERLTVVMPTGSGASVAGLLAGRSALKAPWEVVGVSVSRPIDEMRTLVRDIAAGCARLLGADEPQTADVRLVDAVGVGFGRLTARDVRTVRLALHTEGVLLDATYGAKAIAALAGMVESGVPGPFLLWHTGGLPSAMKLLAQPGHVG